MDPFVIGFISFVFAMAAAMTAVGFRRPSGRDHAMTAEDWEVQIATSPLI